MKALRLQKPGGLDKLYVDDVARPEPGPHDVLIKAAASSLNYHDYIVVSGASPVDDGRIPMSDVAGEVIEVGDNVREFAVGDTVMSTFFPLWLAGAPELSKTWACIPGDSVDGYASEFVCAPDTAFTSIPAGYSAEQAATLPCAAVTAWRGLFTEGRLQPGDTVLVQGSGGVSVFALQLAKAAGARVIATSSSPDKMARLRELGADHVLNYKETPDWGKAAAKLCPRGGVDIVIEVGGPGTLNQSIAACRPGGHIALIGVLTGMAGEVATASIMMKQLNVKGITVGSRADQQALVSALDASGIQPLIDSRFPLEGMADAFAYQAEQKHVGKIVLTY